MSSYTIKPLVWEKCDNYTYTCETSLGIFYIKYGKTENMFNQKSKGWEFWLQNSISPYHHMCDSKKEGMEKIEQMHIAYLERFLKIGEKI